uniref:Uncharacterized protein n=1 Tax=Magallana gigas TaxID=29159 RepID=A0A8W8LX03_MAGGI
MGTRLKDYSERQLDLSSVGSTTDEIKKIKSEVVVRHLRGNKQYDSILKQITPYADKPLSVQYNSATGYKTPMNAKKMGPYLYLGFLDTITAKARTMQGYKVNNVDQTFVNCDANPNSYFTVYFNPKNQHPVGYYKRGSYAPLMKSWLDAGVNNNKTP